MFFCKNGSIQTWQRLFLCICGTLILVFLVYQHLTDDGNRKYDSGNGYVSVPLSVLMSGEPHALSQDDTRITNYIWDHEYIQNPSLEPYNLEKPDKNPSMGQGQFIQKIFQNKTGGFFVEAGGLDGETRSNTLFLEKQLGWTGLIIEAGPKNYETLRGKKRKAWTSNTCLATKPYPHKVVFKQAFNVGQISDKDPEDFKENPKHRHTVVQCFPLLSLLSALQVSVVDYFSLDVEGAEFDVLQNIPFDKVFIKAMSVEFNHVPQGKETLKKFLEEKGYISLGEVTHPVGYANDFIFIHKSLHSTISASEQSK